MFNPDSGLMVGFVRSLNNPGYKIKAIFGSWRDGLEGFPLIGLGHLVGAQTLHGIQRVSQRLYVVGIGGTELVNQAENVAQVVFQRRYLLFIETDTGQYGDFFNVFAGNGHVGSKV
tara:strand:- start:21430 stop:21777 length:348 start_codon:yes stop_codon:yes gene_type:complete